MQMVSPKYPCCTNAFDSPAEAEISAAITRQWVRLINRLEEQKEQAAVTRQEAEE